MDSLAERHARRLVRGWVLRARAKACDEMGDHDRAMRLLTEALEA